MAGGTFRTRWRTQMLRSTLPDAVKLLLVILCTDMRENGHVSVPRAVLAERLGKGERRIQQRMSEARDAGWLTLVRAGYRGHTAEWRACLPEVKGSRLLAPFVVSGSDSLSTYERESPGGPTIDRGVVVERRELTHVNGWEKMALEGGRP